MNPKETAAFLQGIDAVVRDYYSTRPQPRDLEIPLQIAPDHKLMVSLSARPRPLRSRPAPPANAIAHLPLSIVTKPVSSRCATAPTAARSRMCRQQVFVLLLTALAIAIAGCARPQSAPAPPGRPAAVVSPSAEPAVSSPAFDGSSDQLQRSVVIGALNTPLDPTRNTIWCASFQAAWHKLGEDVLHGPVQLDGHTPLADALGKAGAVDLPDHSVVSAGIGMPEVEKIRQAMGNRNASAVPTAAGEHDLIAYAWLDAAVKFASPFAKSRTPMTFHPWQGGPVAVAAFGIEPDQIGGPPAEVLFCRSDAFAVDADASSPVQLILAYIPPGRTLDEMLPQLRSTDKTPVGSMDTLQIPNMIWHINHHFRDLERRGLTNPDFLGYTVTTAEQILDFKLDRSGAEIKSEAMMMMAASALPEEGRQLIFDRPFLLVMQRRGSPHAFFVMWVANDELLTRQP